MARKEFTEQEELEIIEYYKTHTDSNTGTHFNCHFIPRILRVLQKYNISRHTNEENKILYKQAYIQTCLKKYGVTNAFAADTIKQKIKESNIKKYGVDNPSKAEIVKLTKEKTYLEHFGVTHYSKTDTYKESYKNTCIKKYGVDNPLKLAEFREGGMQTKYGVSHPFELDIFKTKAFDTMELRYGVRHGLSNKFNYKNISFDSFPELCLYLYCIKNNIEIIREPIKLIYYYDGVTHEYYPDFSIKGQLVEIKGKCFINEHGVWYNPFDAENSGLVEAKYWCAINNNVKILTESDYQKYLDWFYKNGYKKEDFIV